ncbi:MAG: indolepyruvate ferredoxin oxidoreductase family protein [Hyphomicrobiaceae bacterium]
MTNSKISLDDKYDLGASRVLLTGAQAVLRLALMQRWRDAQAGLDTAGYVTGYRGSPIAGLEGVFQRAGQIAKANHIVFHPALNEDLAATAIWGAQQAELRGEGKYDGVYAIWYGKGPGVDRSGDAFRHANHAGTAKHGGVIALMGDDHTCESSTSAHQSEFAFVDAMMPVLNPAGVQEILDYGVYGLALSRYAGVWVGVKCVKDNFESTTVVDGRPDRVTVTLPTDYTPPAEGLNIRLGDGALLKEARLHDHKRPAILAFMRANPLDRLVLRGGAAPKIGIITSGKSYLDTRQALDELGIDELAATRLGLRLYKVAMTWPLEPTGLARFAQGLDLVIVVEEKRSLIETQVKEQLYGKPGAPIVIGKKDEHEQWLFPAKGALEPTDVAVAIGERLLRYADDQDIKTRLAALKRLKGNKPEPDAAAMRIPYFCAGCPHNSSTVVPAGSRAYAGIGCHYMAQWMDRSTEGFTQMGGEGANWIGEAPFSKRGHVFQNIGDGTYLHSGSLSVRAAVAAGTNVTFKILYNDAVAMTGGQKLDGGMTVAQIAAQTKAEGAKRVVVVSDEPDKYGSGGLPAGIKSYHRRDLQQVQKELAATEGVTVLVYDQTCAAEKRRRRKRGLYPDPPKRAFINTAVCEGCGDCGIKSNCVAIVPVETAHGRKRAIDQSACNKDFSCIEGFCPSFVTVHGGSVRRPLGAARGADLKGLLSSVPEPTLPELTDAYAMLVTGIGGTGVVTISAVLGQAAFLDGKGFGGIDMTGLAQKGGAVACHMRFAADQEQIHAIRAGLGGADLVIGGDLVVTASEKVLETVRPDHTPVIVNTHELMTGEFTRQPNLSLPAERLRRSIEARAGQAPVLGLDAHEYARRLFGDTIASNMLLLGFAFQRGLVPVSAASIEKAVELNGAAVEMNLAAFRLGRLAAHDRSAFDALADSAGRSHAAPPETLDDIVAHRARHLEAYQDVALAQRYRRKIAWIREIEQKATPGKQQVAEAVARNYARLLSYKDEYEVARLYTDGSFAKALAETFEGETRLEFHLAPPLLARRDPVTGHPRKMRFGAWMLPVFRLLARGKRLRGTRWDLFGRTAERRRERQMIVDYERLLDDIAHRLTPATHAVAVALASLPEEVRGFGHVKDANHARMLAREAALRGQLENPAPVKEAAE